MIIVTLTTIPSRIKHIQPVIDNILNQSMPPDRIELYIPKEYKKRSLGSIDPHDYPTGCDIVHCDEDYGPATKILPAIQRYKDQDVTLIYCDDDKIHDHYWIERFIQKHNVYPDACIAEVGMHVKWWFFYRWKDTVTRQYRLKRILSLGIWNPKRKVHTDECHEIALGFGGVLVKPSFFPPEVFDIPDILWTVDDIWLSGMMATNGIKVRETDKNPAQSSSDIFPTEGDPLRNYVYNGYGRDESNILCMQYFIDKYGIWKKYETLCKTSLENVKNDVRKYMA